MATFTSEQQAAIDTYNRQKENAQSYGMRSQSMQKAALNQLKESWVGLNANWFFSLNTTNTTATTPTTTQTTNNQTNYTPTQTQTTQPTQSTQYNEWYWDLWNWNYWEDSDRRQQEIVNNLNEAYASNPNRFSDWSTFAQNFNYDYSGRSDKERETMKNWYEQNVGSSMDYNDVNNTDYFLSQLMWWGTLQGTWAAATAAQNRYRNLQSLSAMSPDQIASAIASGSLNPVWQDMIDLKNYSPALYAQVQSVLQWQTQVNDINAAWQGIYNWLTWTSTNSNYTKYDFTTEYIQNASVIKQYNESLYKKIEWLWWDTAAYVSIVASMLQNPLIQANKDDIEDLEGEVRKIQEQIYTIWDSARAALWSEAPEDLVSAYISNQTKQLQNQLRTAQNSLLVAQWKLDNQLSEVETLIDAINYGLKTYWEDWTWTSWNNYQYVSWSKYQEAGYFDKSTWQFYSLWETPDTRDYQTDDPARLQEIRDNLDAIADSADAYVFRDRNAFNNYFKYSQRWAAQRAILDEFWNANAERLKPIADQKYKEYQARQAATNKWSWWSGWGWWSDNTALWKIKRALIDWSYQWNLETWPKKYWYKNTAEANQLAYQLWRICNDANEAGSLITALKRFENTSSESWTKYNVKRMAEQVYLWYVETNATKIRNALDWMSKTSEKKAYLSSILSPMNLDTKDMRKSLAEAVWAEY